MRSGVNIDEARQCNPTALDGNKVKGNIVLCNGQNSTLATSDIKDQVERFKGLGLIHIIDQDGAVASIFGDFPATQMSTKDAPTILEYVNSTR